MVVITGWDVVKHAENINLIGKLVENPDRANKLNALHKKYTDIIAEGLKVKPCAPSILRRRWTTPPRWWGLAGDMLVQAGGKNIFDDIVFAEQPKSKGNKHQFEIDPEAVLRRNPDIIIKQIGSDFVPPSQEKMAKAIADLEAVQLERVEGSPAKPGFVMSYHCWRHLKADRQTVRCKMALSGEIRGCGPR